MSPATSYETVDYREEFSERFVKKIRIAVKDKGDVNAIRFITKNLLAILPEEGRSIDWYNQHLVVPLQLPIHAEVGDTLEIRFAYDAGAPIEMLSESLHCELIG